MGPSLLPQHLYRHSIDTQRRHLHQVAGRANFAAGFSLVEIMVGMVIGLLGMLVILQVFGVFEGQKRTTTGGDDAQNSAAIALHGLTRDLEQAGYGLSGINLFNCNVSLWGATIPLAPLTINSAAFPAGDPNTDTLLVIYANTNTVPQGNAIINQSGVVYTVQMPVIFNNNDKVIAAPTTCGPATNLFFDWIVGAPTATTVSVANGTTGSTALYNLGQAPQILAYAIRGGDLTVCDYLANNCGDATKTGDSTVWLHIASGIVSMRAQYGRDTSATGAMDGIVDVYDQTQPTTKCGWLRVSSVRLALVAQNSQYDKATDHPVPTANAPVWAGSANAPINLTKKPDGTANPDWQHYRYKMLQTVVPLRNVIWLGVITAC